MITYIGWKDANGDLAKPERRPNHSSGGLHRVLKRHRPGAAMIISINIRNACPLAEAACYRTECHGATSASLLASSHKTPVVGPHSGRSGRARRASRTPEGPRGTRIVVARVVKVPFAQPNAQLVLTGPKEDTRSTVLTEFPHIQDEILGKHTGEGSREFQGVGVH
jgi:hypothetical protein